MGMDERTDNPKTSLWHHCQQAEAYKMVIGYMFLCLCPPKVILEALFWGCLFIRTSRFLMFKDHLVSAEFIVCDLDTCTSLSTQYCNC